MASPTRAAARRLSPSLAAAALACACSAPALRAGGPAAPALASGFALVAAPSPRTLLAPTVGPFLPLFSAAPGAPHSPTVLLFASSPTRAAGFLEMTDAGRSHSGVCLSPGEPPCRFLVSGLRAPDGSIRWGSPVPAPQPWDDLFLGRERLYGLRRAPLEVSLIAADGQSTPLTGAIGAMDGATAQLVEINGRLIAVGTAQDNALVAVPLDGSGRVFPLGLHALEQGATYTIIGQRLSRGRRIAREWAVRATDGGRSLELVWSEVVAPRPGQENAELFWYQDFVRRMSADGKTLDERRFTQGGDPSAPLDTRQIELPSEALQTLVAAGYDPAQGEGLLAVVEPGRALLRRFGPDGQPLGPEQTAPQGRINALGPQLGPAVQLYPTALGWVGLAHHGVREGGPAEQRQVLLGLSGPLAGASIPIRSSLPGADSGWGAIVVRSAILGRGPQPWLYLWGPFASTPDATYQGPFASVLGSAFQLVRIRLDLTLRTAGEPEVVPFPAMPGKQSEPALTWTPWPGGQGDLWIGSRSSDGRCRLANLRPDEPPRLVELGPCQSLHVYPTWNDAVAITEQEVTWLAAGKRVSAEGLGEIDASLRPFLSLSPSFPGPAVEHLAFPGPAGELSIFDLATLRALNGCVASFATGPRRMVLACLAPPAGPRPGLRVGLRSLAF